jgi:hypothetical protein
VACRPRSRWTVLLAVTALSAGCSGSATPTTTQAQTTSVALTTTSTVSATSATAASTTTTTTVPLTTVTTGPRPIPSVPEVSAGWELLPGDVLVANEDGVQVVRDGVVAARPVTSPVDTALPDLAGGLIFVVPSVCDNVGSRPDSPESSWVLWRASADGSATVVFDSRISDLPGPLTLYAVAAVTPVSVSPSAIFTQLAPSEADPAFTLDRVMLLPLDGTATPTFVPAQTPGEGGVTGLGWLEPLNRLVMSTASDGGTWLSAWAIDGEPIDWPTNPVPETAHCPADEGFNDCLRSVTTVPGTALVVYAEDNIPKRGATDLIVFDTATATEVSRVRITEPGILTRTLPLTASSTTVVVSRMRLDEDQPHWVDMPVLVYDLGTMTLTELPIAGRGAPVSQ